MTRGNSSATPVFERPPLATLSSNSGSQPNSQRVEKSATAWIAKKKIKTKPNESQTSKQKEVTFEQRQCNATGADKKLRHLPCRRLYRLLNPSSPHSFTLHQHDTDFYRTVTTVNEWRPAPVLSTSKIQKKCLLLTESSSPALPAVVSFIESIITTTLSLYIGMMPPPPPAMGEGVGQQHSTVYRTGGDDDDRATSLGSCCCPHHSRS